MEVTTRGQTITTTVKIITEDCCKCGMLFGMTEDFRNRKLADKTYFHCPAGHSQHYTGKTDAQKLRDAEERHARELAKQRETTEQYQHWLRLEAERRKATERSLAATRGVVTRQRNKARKAMCPVNGCRRHFANVLRHIEGQHPDWAAEHPDQLAETLTAAMTPQE